MPGRSTTSIRRPSSSHWPSLIAVVVPGKLDVFARAPQSTLKSVVLPVFGFPRSAMRPPVRAAARSGDGEVAGIGGIEAGAIHSETVAGHDDQNLARHGARDADPRIPHLDDERFTALAHPQDRIVSQAERAQPGAGIRIERRLMQPRGIAHREAGQLDRSDVRGGHGCLDPTILRLDLIGTGRRMTKAQIPKPNGLVVLSGLGIEPWP